MNGKELLPKITFSKSGFKDQFLKLDFFGNQANIPGARGECLAPALAASDCQQITFYKERV